MTLFKKRDKNIEHMSWSSKTMSVEEYQELERLSEDCRYEYINGKAYKRKGVSVGHDCIARNIWTALNSQLRSGPCRIFSSGVQVLLEETQNNRLHYVYPDNTITCNCADWRPHNTLIETPRVVIEILAPDTETKDRGVKFKAYQNSPTVQEIVLVNQYYPYVEIWQRDEEHPENPHAWHYRHYGVDEIVELASLNIQLAITEIYQDLNFEEEGHEPRLGKAGLGDGRAHF